MTERIIDIHSKGEYPSNALSNFFAHEFIIDGVVCASMEGFLQSLKFKSPRKQKKVCALYGKKAKRKGKFRSIWKLTGSLYWQGQKISRMSREYNALLDKAYNALLQNAGFAEALTTARDCTLTHSIGGKDKTKTVLTEDEFISQLNRLKELL